MSTVFVTGATGLTGANVCQQLVERGDQVRALVRNPDDAAALAAIGVELVRGDIANATDVLDAAKGCEAAIHTAALLGGASQDIADFEAVNVVGTRHVFDAGKTLGMRRVVALSTGTFLDLTGSWPAEEAPVLDDPPDDPYTVTKLAAFNEAMARAAGGEDIVVCHPGAIYGPSLVVRRALDPTSFNAMLLAGLRGRIKEFLAFPVTWVAARDVASGSIAAMDRGVAGERYWLTGRPEDSVSTAAGCTRACELAGVDHRVVDLDFRDDPEAYTARFGPTLMAIAEAAATSTRSERKADNPTRARLGYDPLSLDEGLGLLIPWLREHGKNRMTPDEITAKVVDGTAWAEFCDLLKDAGQAILAEGNPDDVLTRTEGFRMLTRLLRGALESRLEHGRATHPTLICTCHETIKVVGENPDNHYLGASLDGQYDYVIRGTRGEARWISFNLFSGAGFGGGGPGTGATLHEEQMHFEPDGSFEVVISQREHPGSWLRSEPDTRSIAIRQTFLDKRGQEHAVMTIERLDAAVPPPPPLTPEELYFSLLYAGHYVAGVTRIGAEWATRQAQWPNVFTDAAELAETDRFKDPQITWHQAYVELAPDEALVIEVTPPECDYWMFALHNHWMETLDYTHHQITLNCHSAHVEADGSVRLVVAATDPGVPNWLDTAGHAVGTVGVRWVGRDVVDVLPATRVVKVADLS